MSVDLSLLADQGRKAHPQRASGAGVSVRRRPALDSRLRVIARGPLDQGHPRTPHSSRHYAVPTCHLFLPPCDVLSKD